MSSAKLNVIGKVCVTRNLPTTTNSFTFWLTGLHEILNYSISIT